ncbi:MAG: multicopper oxidase domain-containing protein, partial [Pseudomonadota bacterium]
LKTGISSDDVLVRIPPKNDPLDDDGWPSERPYCIWLPDFHAPGTHWYHAHVHGSTAIQLVNGLAGALIIEEPEDQKIDVDKELIWILQEIVGEGARRVYANLRVPPDQPGAGEKPYGDVPPTTRFTVNSLTSSTIIMQPNEIQRWRFIGATATTRGLMYIATLEANDANSPIVDGVMYTMADDGITYYGKSPQPVAAPGKLFAPGNRVDFLVKFPDPGTYYVWKLAIPGVPGRNELLAIVKVEGEALPDRPLPTLPGVDKAPCYLTPISDEEVAHTERRTFEFGVLRPGEFGGFSINGAPYGQIDPNTGHPLPHPNTDLPLGHAEEWLLTNTSPASHPFHVHVNPFQIVGEKVDPDGPDDPTNWRWADTVLIPANGAIRIRHRFLTYDGAFVLHCHILVHEDVGMMQDLTVVGDGYGPCVAVAECSLTLD